MDRGESDAAAELDAAIRAQPFRVEAIYRKAVEAERWREQTVDKELRDKLEKQIEADLLRVKTLAPHHRAVNRKLGLLHYERGDWARAIAFLETEAALNKGAPANPEIAAEFAADFLHLARAYYRAGRTGDAKASLRHAAQLDPNHEGIKELLNQWQD
jgi:tetratricopeptide (TPR) repeat protein